MTVLTADQFSAQIIAQLRLLDPSISCLVGTPERKIIDSVAQSLADNQVDLSGLSNALDINSKYGSNLDQFTSLFGFARQGSTPATGYVVFSRNTPAPTNINIGSNVIVQSNTPTSQGQYLQYTTTVGGSIAQGASSSTPILVQATTSGSTANAAANTLTNVVGATQPTGVTSVTNPAPITGGSSTESDNAYKVRFVNTVFRNLAGTEDQYLALAVSTSYSTKANVVGPISQYQEYIQIPDVDDAGYLNGVQYANGATLPNGSILVTSNTGGVQGNWTTSESSIPYAKDIYVNPPPFISNGLTTGQYFYRQNVDFNFNYPPVPYGDAEREGQNPNATAPNFTFLNVFNPSDNALALSGLQTATPEGILLSEFSYLSAASRNSIKHNVYNCVDIYVDGSNPTSSSTVLLSVTSIFTTSPTDPMCIENFRRDGEPATRPHPGNFLMPLFQSPLTSLPSTITVTVGEIVYNYYLGFHYWLVHEIDTLEGSTRARDGIEWSNYLNADTGNTGDTIGAPPSPYDPGLAPYNPGIESSVTLAPGSLTINALPVGQQIEIDNYQYDANITVMQGTAEAARPVSTDVLMHSAITRYFKIDVTVVYTPNGNASAANNTIQSNLSSYFSSLTFGSPILTSNLLGLVQTTGGVQNARWSNDLPSVPNQMRVYETDVNGYPLHTPYVDRVFGGSTASIETQRLYIPGGVAEVSESTSTGLTIGSAITSIPVNSLSQAIPAGQIYLYSGGVSQSFTTNGAAAGVTSIPVELQSVVYSFPINTTLYVTYFGPTDSFELAWDDTNLDINFTTAPILLSGITASSISSAISAAAPGSTLYAGMTVSQDTWPINSNYPMTSFLLTYVTDGTPFLPSILNLSVTRSAYTYDSDFFLRDNELAAVPAGLAPNDTVAGAIIRPRAAGTFVRPGIG